MLFQVSKASTMAGHVWGKGHAGSSGASPLFLCLGVFKPIIVLPFITIHGKVFCSFTRFCERLACVLYLHMITLHNVVYLIFMRNNKLFCILNFITLILLISM